MDGSISKSKKIADNTILLYVRMVLLMIINLYTVRLTLRALGSEDYGIYNVVAGFIALFNCVNTVLATATQRFLNSATGENFEQKLKQIFSTSLNIYIVISLFVLLIAETFGIWFLNNHLGIPTERLGTSFWVFQCSLLVFLMMMLQSPYVATIISRENMKLYSILTTLDYCLKLICCIILFLIDYDRLLAYSVLMLFAQFCLFFAYIHYGRKYKECHYLLVKDRTLYRQLLSFSGWTLFASIAGIGLNQVITILINIFFGPIASAARAISMQINSALASFSNSFIMAVRPQMVHSYAINDYSYLNKVFSLSNKFIYYLMMMFCLPAIIEMPVILKIWLGEAESLTIIYSRYIVVYAIILALNNPISIIIQAIGKVKEYHLAVESITLICPILVFLLFKLGFASYYSYIAMVVCIIISHIIRVICINKFYKGFLLKEYLLDFSLKALVITLTTTLVVFVLHVILGVLPVVRLLLLLIVSCTLVLLLAFFYGLNNEERGFCRVFIKKWTERKK